MEVVIKAISKRQWRFLQAILDGTARWHARGNPPVSVASKYSEPDDNAPEQQGTNQGGTWGTDGQPATLVKTLDPATLDNGGMSESLKRGAGILVISRDNSILLGRRADDHKWVTPGGHVEEGEDFLEAALRELKEETGLIAQNPFELSAKRHGDFDTKTFVCYATEGQLAPTEELTELAYFPVKDIPWNNMRDYSVDAINIWSDSVLSKSKKLKDMETFEYLSKNIIRSSGPVYEVTHGDALKLVGSGAFKFLQRAVAGMQDEEFKDVPFDTHIISIRKHVSDVYSGRISDGHKIIHQFTNRSLPTLAAELMSVFEWYSMEDEKVLDGDIDDSVIVGGMTQLSDDYKKHNLANIYSEMENIRKEIRQGVAIDIQQVEARMTKLFDKLEEYTSKIANKHNQLTQQAGSEIDELERKIRDLQAKVEDLSKIPSSVEAIQSKSVNSDRVLDENYCYLTKPTIEILPNGKIRISFSEDWQDLEKENLLKDLRAKMVKVKDQ